MKTENSTVEPLFNNTFYLSIEDSEVVFVSERNNAGLMKLSSFV
jgi:hypothetical protein